MPNRDMAVIRLDRRLCKIYNAIQRMNGIRIGANRITRKNKELYSPKNDTCYILACGPSISNINLKLLKNHTTFTVNFFQQGAKDFESNYHLFLDPNYQTKFRQYVDDFHKLYPSTKIIMKYDYKLTGLVNPDYYYIDTRFVDDGKIRYSMDSNMTGSINVVPVAIECAIYMGFKKIYLLGCDFSMYTKVKDQHFYDNSLNEHNTVDVRNDIGKNNVGNLIRCAFVHKQHYEINDLCKQKGIQILNATDNSLIDAYDFIPYASLEKQL